MNFSFLLFFTRKIKKQFVPDCPRDATYVWEPIVKKSLSKIALKTIFQQALKMLH